MRKRKCPSKRCPGIFWTDWGNDVKLTSNQLPVEDHKVTLNLRSSSTFLATAVYKGTFEVKQDCRQSNWHYAQWCALGACQQLVTGTGVPFVPVCPGVPEYSIRVANIPGFQSHKNTTTLTISTNIPTYPLSHRPATNRKEQETERKMWRLEIVGCGLKVRRWEMDVWSWQQ